MPAAKEPKVTRLKLSELTPDPANANIGTERGLRILDDSLAEVGAGRSIVTDKNGIILAGNKTAERSIDRGIEDALVVHTRGDTLVVVQRDDLDLHDPNPNNPARKLAYYDNRAGEAGLAWDANRIAADVAAGLDVGALWTPGELMELEVYPPDFQPVGIDEQPRLDQKKLVICPECGHEFTPND